MAKRQPKPKGEANGSNRPNCAKEPYIEDWDQYFHNMARVVAQKSKDPRCRVGAVIVSPDKLVTGSRGVSSMMRAFSKT